MMNLNRLEPPQPPMNEIIIHLKTDRSIPGVLGVWDSINGIGQMFRCLGESDSDTAHIHGNPTRDPLKPYGNVPTGTYRADIIYPTPVTEATLRSYGPGPLILLTPVSGDALKANRPGIAIHGGATGAPMPVNDLRPTYGCIRTDDSTIATLLQFAPFHLVTVDEVDNPASNINDIPEENSLARLAHTVSTNVPPIATRRNGKPGFAFGSEPTEHD